jgi:hypothetical protein
MIVCVRERKRSWRLTSNHCIITITYHYLIYFTCHSIKSSSFIVGIAVIQWYLVEIGNGMDGSIVWILVVPDFFISIVSQKVMNSYLNNDQINNNTWSGIFFSSIHFIQYLHIPHQETFKISSNKSFRIIILDYLLHSNWSDTSLKSKKPDLSLK